MNSHTIAKLESKLRPLIVSSLGPKTVVGMYSKSRLGFLSSFIAAKPTPVKPPANLARTCWGIEFRAPLFNAAGIFKNGEGYSLVAAQGAGAYLAGTTTSNARKGNEKEGIYLPFAPYPRSGAASNWLGLPNDGDPAVAGRLAALKLQPGCPIGVSIMGSPDFEGEEKVDKLIDGLNQHAKAGVQFIEINESCPNTEVGKPQEDGLYQRLTRVKNEFLNQRVSGKPAVIVKFSNDTELEQVPALLDMLLELGFDGVNFGNSSTAYQRHDQAISAQEKKLYHYYTKTFGGGLTGRPLKAGSLELVRHAAKHIKANPPAHEFHIIRTGGVESAADVKESLAAGASLVQWYTAYFEQFSQNGHQLYDKLWRELSGDSL